MMRVGRVGMGGRCGAWECEERTGLMCLHLEHTP